MTSRIRRRIVAVAIAGSSALVMIGATAGVASAMVRGHAVAMMHWGRGGAFPVTQSGLNGPSLIGALAISAAVIGVVAWFALRSDRRSRARLSVASSGPSAGESRPASSEDQERKAA